MSSGTQFPRPLPQIPGGSSGETSNTSPNKTGPAQKADAALRKGPQALPASPIKSSARPPAPRLGGHPTDRTSTRRPPAPVKPYSTARPSAPGSVVRPTGDPKVNPKPPTTAQPATDRIAGLRDIIAPIYKNPITPKQPDITFSNVKQKGDKPAKARSLIRPSEAPPNPPTLHNKIHLITTKAAEPQSERTNMQLLKENVVSERFKHVKMMLLALERGDPTVTVAPGDTQQVTIGACSQAVRELRQESRTMGARAAEGLQIIKSEYGIIIGAYEELSRASRETSPPASKAESGLSAISNEGSLGVLKNNRKLSGDVKTKNGEKQGPWKAFANTIRNLFKGHKSM